MKGCWWPRIGLGAVLLPLFAGGVARAQAPTAAGVAVADLKCEYLADPLGIDVARPRLSWRLEARDPSERGQRQTAYQVLASSTTELSDQASGDLWDSGEVRSGQSLLVPYAGRPLASGQECLWKVRVRDRSGRLSAWSKPARWTMGLLQPQDWTAQWIGTDQVFVRKPGFPPPDNAMPDPWLRKSFTLAGKPKRAAVYVASVGYHELYVNGKKIGDAVLAPCVTDHTKRARYVTYDIRDQLRQGENVLGLWLGVSWSIFPQYKTPDRPQTPMAIAQAEIEVPGGPAVRIVTDGTWKTHPSPNTTLGVWDFMHFGGERYDAAKEIPDWCQPGSSDAGWKPVSVFAPKLLLSAEMIEPNRCVQAIRPKAIEPRPKGAWRVDMGVNYAGWVEVDLRGKPGQLVEFRFSEHPDEEMTHRLHSAYVIGPSGKGTFRNRFNYSSGRWITIRGLASKPSLEDVRGFLVRTDYRRTGQFECSNKLLNDIYKTTLWTFENLSLGGYVVDCPQRERMGYGGDAHATIDVALANYDLGAFYTKWAEDWRDTQGRHSTWGTAEKAKQGKPNPADAGNLPYTAPTYWGGGGPGWCGICVTMPWQVYRRYGDVRVLEDNFPMIQRWLAFLETKSADDMLVRWGGEWDFLGDWLWPGAEGVNGDTRETLFFNNCYWIHNLKTAARIADALGRGDAAAAYRRRAERVRKAVHAKFFNPADNSYAGGSQAYLAIALVVDLPPEDLRPGVWKRLEDEILVRRKGHVWAGITGGAFLMKALLDGGRHDLIYAMASKEDYPGWGDMLRRGATTLWESWEGKLSLLHSSYLSIGSWYLEGLAGIQPDPQGGGFQSFVLRPGVLREPGLTWVKGRYDSAYGPIVSQWKIEAGKLVVHVVVPPNTTARLFLPVRNAKSVTEGGKPAADAVGVKLLGPEGPAAVYQLEAGTYTFETEQ